MKCRAIMNLSTEILLRYYDNDVSMFQEWHFVFSYISGFFGLLIFTACIACHRDSRYGRQYRVLHFDNAAGK